MNDTATVTATIRDFMRDRQRELREEADRLHESGAKLDAWSRKMVADELDHCCRMLNKLEFQFRHIPQASRPHPVKGVNCDINGNPVVDAKVRGGGTPSSVPTGSAPSI